MFDLEKAIAAWRQSFRYRRVFFEEDLEELERHVRDHTARLAGEGFTEQEAFYKAQRSVGDYAVVEGEYRKVFWAKLKHRRSLLREMRWEVNMLVSYFKITLRNLRNNKGYAFINIAGLAVGIACCFLILLYVQDELRYDRFHEHVDEIHRVFSERPGQPRRARTEFLLAPTLQAEYPFVQQAVRFSRPYTHFVTNGDRIYTEDRVYYADSTVFDLFSFPLLVGDPETVLQGPDALVITESTARKYFGQENPIGKTLLFDQNRAMVVTGIAADVPSNSHIRFDFLAPLSVFAANWGSGLEAWTTEEIYTYLRLPDAQARATLEADFPAFIGRHEGQAESGHQQYVLQPLADIHLHSAGVGVEIEPQGDVRYVYTFSTIALLILLIACINFVNLSTAQASRRAKEVGMRKVVGAHRTQLVRQFLSESVVISMVAAAVGVLLIVLALPVMNGLTGKNFVFHDVRAHGLYLLGLMLVMGGLAGSYPAFVLSQFKPIAVLKGGLYRGTKGALLRNSLVVFQFAVIVLLLFGAVVVYQQLHFMQTKDLGFEQEEILVVRVPGSQIGSYPTFRAAIAGHPGITSVSASSHVPPATWGYPGLRPQGRDSTFSMKLFAVDFGFIEMLDLDVVSGRSFSNAFATDTAGAFILNETAVRQLGWNNTNALGRQVALSWVNKEGTVVGVVRDFHFRSLRIPVQPAVFTIAPGFFWNVVVKVPPQNTPEVIAFLEKTWQQVVSGFPFSYDFLDQQVGAQYHEDEHLSRLVGYLTLLSIFLACLGLLGLVAFMAERRMKEIGVRKVLGASVPGIVALLSKDITRLVGLSFVVAAPVAYMIANHWLDDFAYRIELSWPLFLLVGLAALGIALLTVSYQTLSAALANPVDTLRYE